MPTTIQSLTILQPSRLSLRNSNLVLQILRAISNLLQLYQMSIENADDRSQRIIILPIGSLVAIRQFAGSLVDLVNHIRKAGLQISKSSSTVLGSLVCTFAFGIDASDLSIRDTRTLKHLVDFFFVLVEKVFDLVLCVFDVRQLSLHFRAIPLSLEASSV